MATQQPSPAPPRVPLVASVSQRGEAANVDARLINGYVEKAENGELWVMKRPGEVLHRASPGSDGSGLFFWEGTHSIYYVVGNTLYNEGVALGTVDTVFGWQYVFSTSGGATPRLYLHNGVKAYRYDVTAGLVNIPNLDGLGLTGAAYLDGTMYVGSGINSLRGSGLNDLTTWDAANVIQAQMLPGFAYGVFRQLSYVVVVKESSTEAFYDAGNPTGSPLKSAPGTFMPYGIKNTGGAAGASSLRVLEDAALWVTSGSTGTSVMMLENMKPRIVSSPAVERLLQQADFTVTYSWAFRFHGHRFYVLTLWQSNLTLVYDLTTDKWFQWSTDTGGPLPFVDATYDATGQCIVQDRQGAQWKLSGTVYADNALSIPVEVITPVWDGGVSNKKFLARMDILADQNATGRLSVRVSDDDYKTWSNWRQVDLSKNQKSLYNCGTFQSRAWHLKYVANTPLRLKALQLTGIQLGD